jgi:ferritin-like protein
MANSVGYHESETTLTPETQDNHRALTSMQEELEAADWYDQRVDAATDPDLKAILKHNRNEEIEHFVMILEWLRRRDAKLSGELQGRLFTTTSIVQQEQAEKGETAAATPAGAEGGGPMSGASLGIGSLKGGGQVL